MINSIDVNYQSSIRVEGGKVIYFDPFKIEREAHDADMIFITHAHYDHLSPEDIEKIRKEDTIIVVPESIEFEGKYGVVPGESYEIDGVKVLTVRAYNTNKPFHPKDNNWVGYVVEINGEKIYVTGDTDAVDEVKGTSCDVLCLPIGGKYTMDASEAAECTNVIAPATVIPTHYGEIVGCKEDADIFKSKVSGNIEVQIKLS